ncbi:DUF3251 domain-containing protein [Pantoea sp. 1.19]|uniref:DUF3251 domain-containing protein n=1 Tax=Pantoea sp. 1.19 TaxID=1925589 RepID=UPI0009491F7F|nr:DUF3251 domain-containing protein [Pantoea sp. 1.19]
MTFPSIRMLTLFTATLVLAGCASTPPRQQQEVRTLHREVVKLNQHMRQLTRQASALERQTLLNQHASAGAWLVPAARAPVELESRAGPLRVSLEQVAMEANGTRATLRLAATRGGTLPAMTARVDWGPLDPVTGKPLAAETLSQTLTLPASLIARAETTVPLRLSGMTPEQLGFVRLYDVQVNSAAPAPPAR